MAATILTVRDWLKTIRDFLKGAVAGVVDASVPEALHGFVATARATTRLKAVIGGSRPEKATRYLSMLVTALPGVNEARLTAECLDALACAYAVQRLQPEPPFEWHRCTSADTPASDLSSIAELSRKAGVPARPHLGPLASAYLSARGAGATKDHSDAWPIHLNEIIAAEPSPRGRANKKWVTWTGCLVCSAFCLRPGVLAFLRMTMFLQYDGGFILVWRWRFKAAMGDIMDPELKTPTTRVSAARLPALTRAFTLLTKGRDRGDLLFPASLTRDMAKFVTDSFPSAPKGFTFRVYGIRIAADVAACALDIPEDITNAMFWWRTVIKSMRAYYGALMVRRMYAFTEARARLKCIHLTPGRFDARLTSGTVPDLSAKAMLAVKGPKLPELNPTDLDAVWGSDGGVASARRATVERVALGTAAWAALPADAPEESDDDGTRSLDCEGCDRHLDRRTRGTLCEEPGCHAVRCATCQTYDKAWRCKPHQPKRPRKAK